MTVMVDTLHAAVVAHSPTARAAFFADKLESEVAPPGFYQTKSGSEYEIVAAGDERYTDLAFEGRSTLVVRNGSPWSAVDEVRVVDTGSSRYLAGGVSTTVAGRDRVGPMFVTTAIVAAPNHPA